MIRGESRQGKCKKKGLETSIKRDGDGKKAYGTL